MASYYKLAISSFCYKYNEYVYNHDQFSSPVLVLPGTKIEAQYWTVDLL